MSLKAMASPAARDPGPLVTLVLSRTVEKVDSIGFDVFRCTQCSAGKSKKQRSCLLLAKDFDHRGDLCLPMAGSDALVEEPREEPRELGIFAESFDCPRDQLRALSWKLPLAGVHLFQARNTYARPAFSA